MDAQQPLPTATITTDVALQAIVRVAKALQKEAEVTAGFKANLPAICDKPKCQICDPSVRRIRFRPQEGSNVGSSTIDFKEKIEKLGGRYPEFWKMFFKRVRWEKWYENSEEKIDVRHFVMDKQALEWAMMFLGHGEFSERKTRRRGHEESESRLRNRSRWILKLRGAIASLLRNWEVISCQLGRTMRKREMRRCERERRRVDREEKTQLRDEVEKCVGQMHLNANMAEPREEEQAMVELDRLKQFVKAQKAEDAQPVKKAAVTKESSPKRTLSHTEELDDMEMLASKRTAELRECDKKMAIKRKMIRLRVENVAELQGFDKKMLEFDALQEVAEVEARGVQVEELSDMEKKEETRKRSLSDREEENDVEMPTPKRTASRRELSLSDRQFFVKGSEESDDEEMLDDAGMSRVDSTKGVRACGEECLEI